MDLHYRALSVRTVVRTVAFPPTIDCRSTVRIFTGKIRDAAEHFRFHDSY